MTSDLILLYVLCGSVVEHCVSKRKSLWVRFPRNTHTNENVKSSFPKRYKSILIVFKKRTFFLSRPIHFVNIQFIMLNGLLAQSEHV